MIAYIYIYREREIETYAYIHICIAYNVIANYNRMLHHIIISR